MNVEQLIVEIAERVSALATGIFGDLRAVSITADVNQFLQDSKPTLLKWMGELQQKQLTDSDFQDLVSGLVDTAQIYALKQAGLRQIQVDKFVGELVSLVSTLAISAAKAAV